MKSVLGGGKWGATLVMLLAHKFQNEEIKQWVYSPKDYGEQSYADVINSTRHNPESFPEIRIRDNVRAFDDLGEVVNGSEFILSTIPSEYLEDILLKMVGMDPDDARPYVDAWFGDTLLDVLRRPRALLPGVRALSQELRRRDIPIGLATSSRREWLEALLGAAELPLETFDAVVWRQMVERSKPAPDLYLKAAELLAVAPQTCIAIEDTPSGIASAQAAGMYAIQVRAASTAFPPIADADLVIDTLEHFPIEMMGAA